MIIFFHVIKNVKTLFFTALFVFSLSAHSAVEGVVQLDSVSQYQQVLALSDVHGMYDTTVELLKKNGVLDKDAKWAAGKTLLVIVGDSIDKGKHSVDVLDLWMRLTNEASAAGGRVITLLGNHEAELLAFGTDSAKAKDLFKELKKKDIKKTYFISAESPWGKFIRNMPVAAKLGSWLFCHAGLYPEQPWKDFVKQANDLIAAGKYNDPFFIGTNSILEAKDWWSFQGVRQKLLERLSKNGIWGVVQGHQPSAYGFKDKIGAIEKGRMIKIDSGMAPEAGGHGGSILKFVNPAEMSEQKFPKIEVLTAKGKVKVLTHD